ncbi:otopetrin-1-like [Cimex lectularius]|uniref:Otopetrin n=1 Tax=Cimex lectularius TaxID=79782 RepID=A0A8I6TGB1_CIMLE|nr:otopetrin-1-like [Cimex lectularius]
MVLQLKNKKVEEEVDKEENFYLGPPDYTKFAPAQISNFTAKRKLWLFSNHLAQQTTVFPLHKFESQGFYVSNEDGTVSLPPDVSLQPVPSSAKDKEEMFRSSLTIILSCVYAVFIVTLGVVVYIGELMSGKTPMAEFFSIYLVIVGLGYLSFLYMDMRKYLRILKISEDMVLRKYELAESQETDTGEPVSIVWNSLPEPDLAIPHHYCFSSGRHSGSFYLKVGAAGFCMGHLIHSGLLISYQVAFLITDSSNFYKCANVLTLVLDLLYPTYSFFQLFFIFKYSNVIINRFKILARFALMHCIGSSLCFWIWTILRETVDSLYHSETENPISLHHLNTHYIIHDLNNSSNVSLGSLTSEHCRGPKQFQIIFATFSPYLYPFTIEYSILVVGVLFIIWQNIGSYSHCTSDRSTTKDFISNVVLYADCHSSNKGLFAGLIVLAGSFLSIILFFVAMTDSKYIEVGLSVNSCTELILILLMTASVIPAYHQITKLDVNSKQISLLDDLLLFTCIPAFFVQTILSVIPSWNSNKYVNLTTIILQMIQVLIQTPFIIDGLRRCANSKALRSEKPGRELLTFLIVCNVTMWITETFEIKSHSDHNDPRSSYYGEFLWSTITHLTFPLTMFYRFHSSVCMVDIWKSAYVKGN